MIAEAPDTEELRVDPDGVADQAQLLRRDQSADLEVPAPHEERVQGRVPRALVQVLDVREVVDDSGCGTGGAFGAACSSA